MHIGINARALTKVRTGMGRVLINLLRCWAQSSRGYQFILYSPPDSIYPSFLDKNNAFDRKLLPYSPFLPAKRTIWEQVILPKQAVLDKVDVLFCPSYTAPLVSGIKAVTRIDDAIASMVKGEFPPGHVFSYGTLTRWAAKISKRVITDSQVSKKEIVKCYKLPEAKVKVVYLASDPIFSVVTDERKAERAKRKYGIKSQFIFYVGSMFNRRHIPGLLMSFQHLAKEIAEIQLLMAGANRTYPVIDIPHFIHDLGLSLGKDIIWVDHLSDEDLLSLYNSAAVFVYVSSHEGFGIPILEAMACGCPVITSNVSALPEVAGDAALLVTPGDVDQLTEAIGLVLSDKGLRQSLIEKGLQRVKLFSWEKAARETLRVLEEVHASQ